jgi:hypothetical protein
MGKVGKAAAEETAVALAPPTANALAASRPAHLTSGDKSKSDSMTLITNYVVPPRLKIMQKMRKAPLDRDFGLGDVVVMPMKQLIAAVGDDGSSEAFPVVPVFFFPEYISINPIELSQLPMIRERSFDPRSKVAALAKNPDTRKQPHPDDNRYSIKNSEVLTFIVCISDPASPVYNLPISVSFSRGEYKYGQAFASGVRMRNVDQCFGCQFEASSGVHKNEKFDWYGLNINNPTKLQISPWVDDPQQFAYYEGLYTKFAADYASNLLRVEIDEDMRTADDLNSPVAQEAAATANGGGQF